MNIKNKLICLGAIISVTLPVTSILSEGINSQHLINKNNMDNQKILPVDVLKLFDVQYVSNLKSTKFFEIEKNGETELETSALEIVAPPTLPPNFNATFIVVSTSWNNSSEFNTEFREPTVEVEIVLYENGVKTEMRKNIKILCKDQNIIWDNFLTSGEIPSSLYTEWLFPFFEDSKLIPESLWDNTSAVHVSDSFLVEGKNLMTNEKEEHVGTFFNFKVNSNVSDITINSVVLPHTIEKDTIVGMFFTYDRTQSGSLETSFLYSADDEVFMIPLEYSEPEKSFRELPYVDFLEEFYINTYMKFSLNIYRESWSTEVANIQNFPNYQVVHITSKDANLDTWTLLENLPGTGEVLGKIQGYDFTLNEGENLEIGVEKKGKMWITQDYLRDINIKSFGSIENPNNSGVIINSVAGLIFLPSSFSLFESEQKWLDYYKSIIINQLPERMSMNITTMLSFFRSYSYFLGSKIHLDVIEQIENNLVKHNSELIVSSKDLRQKYTRNTYDGADFVTTKNRLGIENIVNSLLRHNIKDIVSDAGLAIGGFPSITDFYINWNNVAIQKNSSRKTTIITTMASATFVYESLFGGFVTRSPLNGQINISIGENGVTATYTYQFFDESIWYNTNFIPADYDDTKENAIALQESSMLNYSNGRDSIINARNLFDKYLLDPSQNINNNVNLVHQIVDEDDELYKTDKNTVSIKEYLRDKEFINLDETQAPNFTTTTYYQNGAIRNIEIMLNANITTITPNLSNSRNIIMFFEVGLDNKLYIRNFTDLTISQETRPESTFTDFWTDIFDKVMNNPIVDVLLFVAKIKSVYGGASEIWGFANSFK